MAALVPLKGLETFIYLLDQVGQKKKECTIGLPQVEASSAHTCNFKVSGPLPTQLTTTLQSDNLIGLEL